MISASFTACLLLMIPTLACAAVPDQTQDTSLGLAQRSWLENSGKVDADSSGSGASRKPSGLDALVVKFSKYDVLFWDLIGNAAHGSTDGYQVKYKFVF